MQSSKSKLTACADFLCVKISFVTYRSRASLSFELRYINDDWVAETIDYTLCGWALSGPSLDVFWHTFFFHCANVVHKRVSCDPWNEEVRLYYRGYRPLKQRGESRRRNWYVKVRVQTLTNSTICLSSSLFLHSLKASRFSKTNV